METDHSLFYLFNHTHMKGEKQMIREAIGKLVLKENLTTKEMEEVMGEITTGGASTAQIASFVTALRMKGETPEEITAAAKVIRDKVSMINAGDEVVCMGREEITAERGATLGTAKGWSEGKKTINISTTAAV